MKITFHLNWLTAGRPPRRAFKSEHAFALFNGYVRRIAPYAPTQIDGSLTTIGPKGAGTVRWLCHNARGSRALCSRDLAAAIETLQVSGAKELRIAIGGADGFSDEDIDALKPHLLLSFGPMTLPHELAAVVASEQIYRAWTIIRREPYHLGH